MAQLDRVADKAAQHRTSRRQTYVSFMTVGVETYRAYNDIHLAWRRGKLDASEYERLSEVGIQCGRRLIDARGAVQVEGPEGMADKAETLTELLRNLSRVTAEVYRPLAKEGNGGAKDEQLSIVEEAGRAASNSLGAFVKSARETLDEL